MSEYRKLEFSTTSLLNTIISDDADRYYYEVLTPDWQPFVTTVRRLDLTTGKFVPVAEIENTTDSKFKPVTVKLPEGTSKTADAYLPSHSDNNKTWRIQGADGQVYLWVTKGATWRRVPISHHPLVQQDRATPLVVHHQEKKYLGIFSTTQDLSLEVDQSVMDTLDTIIVSFLLAERRRRDQAGYFKA